jgi:transposase-like protein
MIAKSWRSNWARVIPLFAHPPEIRKVIYTTNAIESLNMSLRKVTKARGSFPNDEAVSKLLYLALRNIAKNGPCRSTPGRTRSTASPSSTKTGCRRAKPGNDDEMKSHKQNRAMETVEKQTTFSHRSHSPYCC